MATWYDGATFLVEVEFVSTVWTDITQWVMDVQIDRGRAYERDSFQPGRLSLLLDNRDRRFDPEHSAGAYAPLKAMRQVRVTFNGTRIYTGWIQGWPQDWSDPSNAVTTCTVFALDALTILATMALPESRYFSEVMVDAPTAYYRFGEAADATVVADSSGNGRAAEYGAAVPNSSTGTTPQSVPANSLIVGSSNSARFLPSGPTLGDDSPQVLRGMPAPSGTAFTFECWGSALTATLTLYSTVPVSSVDPTAKRCRIVTSPQFAVAFNDGAGGANYVGTVTAPTVAINGGTHHIVVTRSGATVAIYFDGVSQPITVTGAVGAGITDFGTQGYAGITQGGNPPTIDEYAVYPTALSAARVLAHYVAGATASAGQTVDARITTALTDSGYTGSTSLEASAQTVQAANYAGGNVLAYLQALERTEQGRLFVNASGALTLHARYHDLLNSSFAVVVSDDAASSFRYAEMQTEFSVGRVVNDVTATRSGGVAQRVKDATSAAQPPTGYGVRSLSIDSLLGQSDLEVNDLATYMVQRNKDPQTRVPKIRILPRVSPSTWFSVVASLEIGQKISFVRTPQNVGSGVNKSVIVEAIRWRLTPQGDFDYELQTSPVDDVNGNFLVLDDTTRGQLDSNRLGF
jgi:hypothetical protein